MKDKIMNLLKKGNWKLLGQYHNEYPSDWIKTINRCLNDKNNLYEFRYNSNKEIQQIRIITNYGTFNSEWNYYIVFN